jgi:hypothetical protein
MLLVFGIIAMFIGVIWIGQGMGFFPYPASSFMLNQTQWAHFGFELALAGLVLIVLSRKGKKSEPDEPTESADENTA